jgi:hypothetical protein
MMRRLSCTAPRAAAAVPSTRVMLLHQKRSHQPFKRISEEYQTTATDDMSVTSTRHHSEIGSQGKTTMSDLRINNNNGSLFIPV